jgi:hypothetical protein
VITVYIKCADGYYTTESLSSPVYPHRRAGEAGQDDKMNSGIVSSCYPWWLQRRLELKFRLIAEVGGRPTDRIPVSQGGNAGAKATLQPPWLVTPPNIAILNE